MPHHVTGVGKPSQPNRARRRHDGRGGRRFGRLPRVLLLCDRDSKALSASQSLALTTLLDVTLASRDQTRKAILEPPSFRLAFCRCGPRDSDATWVARPRHGWVIWDADEAAHQAVSSHPLCRILSVAILPKASNAQAGPTTSNPEWGRIPAFLQRGSPCFFWACHPTATTPLVAHQFSPGARSRSVAIVRTQSHFYRRSVNRRPRDRHRHFILALTRTGPLSIYPCPPAFRQTGDAWLRSHVPC